MKKEQTIKHALDMLGIYAHMEDLGPENLEMFGPMRVFASLPKKTRRATIVQMDTEMQALAHHRRKPYVMPPKAYKRAVEDRMLIRPEGKRQLKAWRKVRRRALREISESGLKTRSTTREV